MISSVGYSPDFNFNPAKRKREPEKKSEEVDVKRQKSDSDFEEEIVTDTNFVSLDELNTELVELLQGSFPDRIQALRNYSSLQENGIHDLYVRIDEEKELDIYIKIREKRFNSKALTEETFKEGKEATHYYYIVVCESVRKGNIFDNERVLKIRCSPSGSKGELEWIQKGVRLSGNDVLAIYQLMEKILKPQEMILYDDSRLPTKKTRGKNKQKPIIVSLRKLMALSSPDEHGYSLYEKKLGFTPAACKHFPTKWNKISQDPNKYREAICEVRNTPLSTILRTHRIFPNSVKTTVRLRAKYIPEVDHPNVHQLVSAMNVAAQSSSKIKREATHKDLESFFKEVITRYTITPDPKDKPLFKALKILEKTRIYIKTS